MRWLSGGEQDPVDFAQYLAQIRRSASQDGIAYMLVVGVGFELNLHDDKHRQAEVLDFARFLGQFAEKNTPAEVTPEARIELRLAPSDTLLRLTGLVALGGDALVDSEALYDDNGSH